VTEVVDGVAFTLPPARYSQSRAFYRDQLLQLRNQSPVVNWPYPPLASSPDPGAVPGPAILVTFHIGPLAALSGLLARLAGPVCVLRGAGQVVTRKARYLPTFGGEAQRAAAVTEAVHTLRAGGYALVVVDNLRDARVPATLLGRSVPLAGGAFALARLAPAPLLPVAVRWRGPSVAIVAGEMIEPADETAMADSLARWLEAYLRRHPRELSFTLSKRLGLGGSPPV
jgi:lauroyl/myristoyl acyltransferase